MPLPCVLRQMRETQDFLEQGSGVVLETCHLSSLQHGVLQTSFALNYSAVLAQRGKSNFTVWEAAFIKGVDESVAWRG